MKIDRVTVRYGELKSTGYPTFSNKRAEVELSAMLESGETAQHAKDLLMQAARAAVWRELGVATEKCDDPTKVPF